MLKFWSWLFGKNLREKSHINAKLSNHQDFLIESSSLRLKEQSKHSKKRSGIKTISDTACTKKP